MKRLENLEKLRISDGIEPTRATERDLTARKTLGGWNQGTNSQQKDKIGSLLNTPTQKMEQGIFQSDPYNESLKSILKKIEDSVSESQQASQQKEILYQIKSQNLFIQGPQSMIQRDMQYKLNNAKGITNEIKVNSSRNQSLENKSLVRNSSNDNYKNLKDMKLLSPQFVIRKTSQHTSQSARVMKSFRNNLDLQKEDQVKCFDDFITPQNSENINEGRNIYYNGSETNEFTGIDPSSMNNQLLSSSEPRNDTRFKELQRLSAQNSRLKQKIKELEGDIASMDEFKLALKYRPKAEDLSEKRIDLMKAQIVRQQKYIKRLTGLLQGSKKIVKEAMSIIQFFSENSSRTKDDHSHEHVHQSQSMILNNQNQNQQGNQQETLGKEGEIQREYEEDDKIKLGSSEEGILSQLDSKLSNISLRTLLNNIGLSEEKESFFNTFTSAYDKIVEYERQNKEYTHLFSVNGSSSQRKLAFTSSIAKIENTFPSNRVISDINLEQQQYQEKKNKIKYKYPVANFLKRYEKYLPINTIFTSFPSQQRDTLQNMLRVLSCTIKKCGKAFKQAKIFSLFKSNPFLYIDSRNRLNLPETLVRYKGDFESYLHFKDKMVQINLSHKQLSKTESLLSVLLDSLTQFFSETISHHKNDTSLDIQTLIQNTRKAIEQLISLGVIVGPDSGYNHARFLIIQNTIHKEIDGNMKQIRTKMTKEELAFNNNNPTQMESGDNSFNQTLGSQNQLKLKIDSQKQLQIMEDINDLEQLKTLRVDKDADCTSDFFDQHSICENIFEDLYRSIKCQDHEESITLSLKLGSIINKLKTFFEMKDNILLIKETQIDFLKNQVFLYKQDIQKCQEFVEESQEQISQFFSSISTKLSNLLLQFNNVMDGSKSSDPKSRKNLILFFKRTLKEVMELIKKIEDKPSPIHSLNIKQIKQNFQDKVELVTAHYDSLRKLH